MTTILATPTVHINGTSKQALIDQLGDAIHALHEAGRKLAAATPNARDYYVQGNDAFTTAMRQHDARMTKLREIVAELETIGDAVFDQGG
jgi:hypothetical protein